MKKLFLIAGLLFFQLGFSQLIIEAQYWFDDKFDDRIPLSITTNSNGEIVINVPYPGNIINITNEINATIHMRFKDSNNNWSPIYSQQMIDYNGDASQTVVNIQYWFDNYATKTKVPINNVIINNQLDYQDLDFDWHPNAQKLYYRFQGVYNQWSSIQTADLENINYENNIIVQAEYWFGDDFSGKESISITGDANNEIQFVVNYPDTGINQLNNTLHYRFKDIIGNWSSIQSSNIDEIENKNNKIVEAQWWLNDDFDDKTTMPVTHTGEAFLDIRDLTLDAEIQNTIHVRYKDKMNRWSSIFSFFPTEPGITVLVHGFQLTGGGIFGEFSPTEDFEKMGAEIIKRAGSGVMFKNNPSNGQIEFIENVGETQYELNNKKEIVLVYDWGDLSNNPESSAYGGNGYLESAADNLFATIINLPSAMWGQAATLTKEQILAKPIHFIAHSRGTILTLQLLHRFATYFPETTVEQFTLLDPHPATTFGDMQSEQEFSPVNLPCVYGVATGCTQTIGCETVGNDVYLKIPENVLQADNYYRKDTIGYEGIGNVGQFDGIPVLGLGLFDRELNDINLGIGAPILGGTHSAVHKWYRGTINTDEVVAKISLFSSAEFNTNNWYINGSTNTNNNFLQTENRYTTGFNLSRIGKGKPIPEIPNNLKESLTEMNRSIAKRYGLSLTDYPDGVALHTVFGGYFDNSNDAGWEKNGGLSTDVEIINGNAEIAYRLFPPLPRVSKLKHSLMYFPGNYNFLKINIYEANSYLPFTLPTIKVTFFDNKNIQIGTPILKVLYASVSEEYFPIPNNLIGNVGTFMIEYNSDTEGTFKVDEIKLTEFGPNGYCDDTTTWVSTAENPNGEWTNGKPVYGSNVIISHNYTATNDNVSEDDNIDEPNKTLEGCVLTVNNGAIVKIVDGFNVKLNGALKVNSGTFTLENNASLIQNSTEFPNVGAITVKRNTNALMRLDYTMWSSPVENQNLLEFSPSTTTNRFYTYNSSSDVYQSIDPIANNFADANGYLIRITNNHPITPTIWEGKFFGVPHNGRFNLDVQNGTYNAIGNPYPSPIKADLFIQENNLTEAIYFWRKTNNSINPSYATYTLAGGTGTKANIGGGSDIVPNGIIQTGQGFIAKATSNRLSFQNYMRFANNENQFFRTEQDKSRIWLNLTNASGFFCQTMFGYMPTATDEIDAAIDGHFLINEPIHLCSIINNEEFVIQGRAPFEVSDIVPLGFKTNVAGNYQIEIDHSDGLFSEGQEIYLKDNLLNIEHEITESPYSFATEIGVFNSRFEIVYQSTLSTDNPLENNTIIVYKQNATINVDAGNKNIKSITVYDLRGRLIFEENHINERHFNFRIETANQVFLIKVETEDELIVTKKVVN